MSQRQNEGNMRLNHEEENIHGQGECRSSAVISTAPAAAIVAPAAGTAPTAAPEAAAAPKKSLPKACRHHVDETLGGAHHD